MKIEIKHVLLSIFNLTLVEEIYIVTGPILTNVMESIGLNSVSIPRYFYKVILDYNQPEIKGIGFVIENKKGELSLTSYAVSIDDVEKWFQLSTPDL